MDGTVAGRVRRRLLHAGAEHSDGEPLERPFGESIQVEREERARNSRTNLIGERPRVTGLTQPSPERSVSFGSFRLFPAQQLLLEAEKPVRLGSRALDILSVLVEHAGEVVSKDELMNRIWPHTFVEECNLRTHIAGLRRALGDGQAGRRYIANVPGRGYRFVAPVGTSEGPDPANFRLTPADTPHNLPAPLTRMIGRDAVAGALSVQLPRRRFITITGPGGIGKTTVAMAVADRLMTNYPDGVWFVDHAPITDPMLVAGRLAAVLGIGTSRKPMPEITAAVRDKRMLVVLDSCEHVTEAVASVAVDLLRGAPGVNILATSREPLRAEGEYVQRLMPLPTPPVRRKLTAVEALAFPAVQLFVERADACLGQFELTDSDAPLVAAICRRLDGIALAIELAAGRIDTFGVGGLAAALDDRLRLLTRGRRTAVSRHQALSATLDWSYEFLPEVERTVLRRLAAFDEYFSLESAIAVVADSMIPAADVAEGLSNLVAKSLVTVDISSQVAYYRLLETHAAYARAKLSEIGEYEEVARRRAEDLQWTLAAAGLRRDGAPMMPGR
jgi:predicted ATPase/DNA-binding winged helix-turn-helix (wHTH) protein